MRQFSFLDGHESIETLTQEKLMERGPELHVYRGSCHCGNIQFQFQMPRIERGCRCNCSICIRRNAIMSDRYVPAHLFRLICGATDLKCYKFGDRVVNHYFCNHCGIYTFHDADISKVGYRINLGCVEGLDAQNLPLREIDGASF